MTTQRKIKLVCIFLVCQSVIFSQRNQDLQPGVDRWQIKVSAQNFTSNKNAKNVSLKKLLILPLLEKKYSSKDYDETLIPKKVGVLHEGDIISTVGYLHLVALENASNTHKDGDYHIQMTPNPQWSDSCFIVEIPTKNLQQTLI
jgi:hypothetical protein